MKSVLNDYLPRLELREPQQFKNITILPIFSAATNGLNYLTLSEALEQRLATITEVSQSGQVPNGNVTNASDLYLLLVDGQELIGARQNRPLNTSILLSGKSETVVPVSCTEAGRWAYKSAVFADAGYVSPHKLRKTKSSSVSGSLKAEMGYKADQQAVWGEVAHYCLAANAQSSTSAMHDAISAKARELDECLQHLK